VPTSPTCNTCHGGGNVPCGDCHGAGYTGPMHGQPCRTCRRTGHVPCVVCEGSGHQLEPSNDRKGRRRRVFRGWRWW
jgi:hypothetical protein